MENTIGEYTGTIVNGVVILQDGESLPEGTRVRVLAVDKEVEKEPLGKRLLKFAGTIPGLPPDMAENHDHYIHGQPKR